MDSAVVTGAAGFVGAALVAGLADSGVPVRALVHPRTDAWRLAGAGSAVTVDRVDLGDVPALRSVLAEVPGAVVFHAAARGGHPTDPAGRAAGWTDTVAATEALWDAVAEADVARVVHLGSSLEYAPAPGARHEDDPIWPATPRGVLKAASALVAVQRSGQHDVPLVGLRLFSVYGPREQHHRVVPTLVRCLREGTAFRLTAGRSQRDFVYVDDVVEACLAAATAPRACGMCNVGTGVETSIEELASTAERIAGATLRRDPEPFRGDTIDLEHSRADTRRAAEVLGWTASTDLETGLARTFAAAAG